MIEILNALFGYFVAILFFIFAIYVTRKIATSQQQRYADAAGFQAPLSEYEIQTIIDMIKKGREK